MTAALIHSIDLMDVLRTCADSDSLLSSVGSAGSMSAAETLISYRCIAAESWEKPIRRSGLMEEKKDSEGSAETTNYWA